MLSSSAFWNMFLRFDGGNGGSVVKCGFCGGEEYLRVVPIVRRSGVRGARRGCRSCASHRRGRRIGDWLGSLGGSPMCFRWIGGPSSEGGS